MKPKTNIISLDLETSGIIPGKHVPLSIGAVKLDADLGGHVSVNSFYVQLEWDSLVVDPEAMKINCLNIADPPGCGPFDHNSSRADDALSAFSEWLGDEPVVALGKNVGSFDLPMLRAVWDHGMKRTWPFGYRAIDINTILFTISTLTGLSFETVKHRIVHSAWRKTQEQHSFARDVNHHALADAWWNVHAWQECLAWIKELGA